MRSEASTGPSPIQPVAAGSAGAQGPAFPGFHPLSANFTQVPNEVWDLQMPGLTIHLRWTLGALARETIGEAYRRGGSPYDFLAIPWVRWMTLLDLQSINAVKTRLARLEAMGLIEIQPGQRGPWGTTVNRYRLRWVNDGQAATRTFHRVVDARAGELRRKHRVREGGCPPADTPLIPPGYPRADTPPDPGCPPADTPPADTPRVSVQADTPSFKQTECLGTTVSNKSVSPSVPATDRPTDGLIDGREEGKKNEDGQPTFDAGPWLRRASPEPWPEPLLRGLGGVLEPLQVPRVEGRSPWGAEGAWAILQAILARGRNLDNQPGTLWNALVRAEKGTGWLAMAGPLLREAGWRGVEADGTPRETEARALGRQRLARAGFHRLPLNRGGPERHPEQEARARGREPDPELDLEDEVQSVEAIMIQPCEDRPIRPEELPSEVKARLRARIEAFREDTRIALGSPSVNSPGFFDACTRSWKGIREVLEPVLPLEVVLQDDHRPVAIRSPSQIKMNVLTAVYKAVS